MNQLSYFRAQLAAQSYAPTTIINYCKHIPPFLKHFQQEVEQLPEKKLQAYIDQTAQQSKWSFSTRKQCISALRLFYTISYKRTITLSTRPSQRQTSPPYVFSPVQTEQLFSAAKNIKHKSILMTIYSGGLRVSEVTKLRLSDIDGQAMQLHVTNGLDKEILRTIPLSKRLWETLQVYHKAYRPKYWLFEGHQQKAYSTRNIQNIFCETLQLAQLPSKATTRTLRHSFAVHLLQQGVDLHQVNQLLGHHSLTTTQRYVRLLKNTTPKVTNPLDNLFLIAQSS